MPDVRSSAVAGAQAAAMDVLPCGIVSFEDNGTIVFVNATLVAMLGYGPGELEGRHVEELLTVAGRIFFQTHLFPLVRLHGRADELFVLLRRSDGSEVGALLNAVRGVRADRAITDCAIMEVRERRKYEDALLRAKQAAEAAHAALAERTRQLEQANELLEEQALELELQHRALEEQATELELARAAADEANRAKSRFLGVMSHELRTPLNAIGGYVQLLELGIHGPLTDAQRETLERITRGQRRLLGLINDLLNLSRIEAGRVDYVLTGFKLADAVAGVMPMLEPQIAGAGLAVRADVPPDLFVHADHEKVQQILINLLTNAVKFTPRRGTLGITAARDPSAGTVAVSVTDTGIGIAPEQLETVFEPFVQVRSGETERREGTGLGLAISRDLARGMGGDLRARSAIGEGSTFTLVLREAEHTPPAVTP